MWIPSQIVEWFGLNAEMIRTMQSDLAVVRAERDALKIQLVTTQANFDWLRIKVNQMEAERAGLMERAYNIKLPVPEIVRTTPTARSVSDLTPDLFNDMGEDMAKQLGLPTYNN